MLATWPVGAGTLTRTVGTLVAVVAPFFTSFILRTIAWRQVLADSGPVTGTLHTLHILPAGQSLTASGTAVVAAARPMAGSPTYMDSARSTR